MRRRARRRGEKGFALLLVFAMAAAVVVMLYLESPRLATEALRSKEQLLIDRGEQYQRAIQIFTRTVKKYPQTLDELEKFQDKRFLRRRYKDPFTNEEWRLIHTDGSVFTDSKVYGPKKEGDAKGPNTFVTELPSLSNPTGDPNDPNAQSPATQRRASDRPAIASGQGGGEAQPVDPNAPPPDPNNPQARPGANPAIPGMAIAPGQPGAAPVIPGAPGIPGMPSFRPANPIQTPQGQPGATPGRSSGGGFIGGSIPSPGGVSSSQGSGSGGFIGGGSSPTQPSVAGRPGVGAGGSSGAAGGFPGIPGGTPGVPGGIPGGGPGQVPTAAADLIRQILTTPRQGGMPGAQGGTAAGLGPGIAGIASKKEATGIKVYNERTRYDEWEFVYDQTKEAQKAMNAAGGGNRQGTNQPGGPLQPGTQQNSSFGGSTFGAASGTQTPTSSTPSTGSSSSSGGGFIGGSIPAIKK